jgi:hypothetical protein
MSNDPKREQDLLWAAAITRDGQDRVKAMTPPKPAPIDPAPHADIASKHVLTARLWTAVELFQELTENQQDQLLAFLHSLVRAESQGAHVNCTPQAFP